jgi:hypothetical protein
MQGVLQRALLLLKCKKTVNMKNLKELVLWLLIFGFIIAKRDSEKVTPQSVIIVPDSTESKSTITPNTELPVVALRTNSQ